MLDLNDRLLLNDGSSVVTDEYAVAKLLETGDLPEHVKVVNSRDSDLFNLYYNTKIDDLHDEDDITPELDIVMDYDILELLKLNKRDDTDDDTHLNRVMKEYTFFKENDHLELLYSIRKLINTFKEDGVVWGVGRGSSCASYILYLLEVHDINPIKFDINFNEFSKEE